MAGNSTAVEFNHESNISVWSDMEVLVENLTRLMEDKDSCDVIFIVGKNKERFHAHSLILRVRCGKFRDWSEKPDHRSPTVISEDHFRPAVFEKILKYIYTGKVEFSTSSTLEMLRIAHHLGIPDLVLACEKYFLEKLSVDNSCEFFMDSLSISSPRDCQDENLADKCRKFIEENAADVVKTEGFLNLSKEALIQLISSDQFVLPEEEVWYAVLRWSKYQAKVEESVRNWNDKERKLVCEHLSDVIGYVRLLLIDSKVFAEEVEPTGAVPMELSLERYRYAAVPDTFHNSNDIRLRTRVSHKLFQGTTILQKTNVKYQEVLNKWFGNTHQQWDLLYKGSRDGFSAETFHQKCDGFTPTYIVVKGFNGSIFGGFADVLWKSEHGNGKYIKSTRSFLFTLINSEGIQPTKFDVLRPKYAILNHFSYGGALASEKLFTGEMNFKVADYEVFSPRNIR